MQLNSNKLDYQFVIHQKNSLTMAKSNKKVIQNLKNEYLNLVKAGLQIQERGDIKAYTTNAIQAEHVAQKLQAVSRRM